MERYEYKVKDNLSDGEMEKYLNEMSKQGYDFVSMVNYKDYGSINYTVVVRRKIG